MRHTGFVLFRGRKYTLQMKDNRCVSIIRGAKIPCKYQMTDLLGGIIRNILCSQCRRRRSLQKMRFVVSHVAYIPLNDVGNCPFVSFDESPCPMFCCLYPKSLMLAQSLWRFGPSQGSIILQLPPSQRRYWRVLNGYRTGIVFFFEGCSQHCTRAGKLGFKKNRSKWQFLLNLPEVAIYLPIVDWSNPVYCWVYHGYSQYTGTISAIITHIVYITGE